MKTVAYLRISTGSQDLTNQKLVVLDYARQKHLTIDRFEAQLKELQAAGCEKVFREQASSVAVRAQLQAALEFVREGDVLVVTQLDRLVRSVAELMVIIQAMDQKQVGMRILNLGMDTRTPTGKLMLTVLGGVAQFEREMMLERQAEVRRLAATGMAKARIALELRIGEATVYRILARDREQAHPASLA